MRDGVLTRVEGEERVEETLLTVPGNYPAYYAAIRDALNGDGENPVPASQAIQVMELIELGIESANIARLCALHEKWMVHLHHPFVTSRRLFLAVRVFPQR
ncbi:oxidoreductase [Escherichia coli]|nr:oxidoreductase [Escherichia coli]